MESNNHQDEIPITISFGTICNCDIVELTSAQYLIFGYIRDENFKTIDGYDEVN